MPFRPPPPRSLSRRGLLRAAAATAAATAASVAASAWAKPASAATTDAFGTLRSRWGTVLSGGAIDPTDPVYATALAALNGQADSALAELSSASGSDRLFADLPLGTASANLTASLNRLESLALAYVTPGTRYTGDDSVREAVVNGLDLLTSGPYAPGVRPYGNWWDWQIGSSQALVDTATLVYPALSPARIAAYCAAVDAFVPDPTLSLIVSSGATYTSTGANRLDECRAVIVRGALAGDAAKVAQGVAGISAALPLVTTGDGLYADGSWIQHGYIAYTGTYGAVWFGDLIKLMYALAGTPYQISDPQVGNVRFAATDAFAPVVYNGLMLDAVRGRAVARPAETDVTDGAAAARDLLMLAPAVPDPALALRLRSLAKGWLQRSPQPVGAGTSVAAVALARQVLADESVPAAPEPVGHTLFAAMDRAVHRRPGWAAAVSMSSERIAYYENDGSVNLHGWHTGDGMVYLYLDSDDTQYNDGFWPTVDPYRLPGTTASLLPLADGQGGSYAAVRPAAAWVGGATDGEYAAIGQDLRGPFSTLTAKKSWFCLDDAVVCLGAGITSSDGREVDTTIENRNLHAGGANALTVDGRIQPAAGGRRDIQAARWAHIEGVAGYVLPGGAALGTLREQRTAAWHDIDTGDTSAPLTRDYLTLFLDHGVDPEAADYCYLLLPGAGRARTAARAADRAWLRTLANTPEQQGVQVPGLGVTAVNFFSAGTAGPLTASAPACVLIREHRDGTATVCVSDPSRRATALTVTWARRVEQILSAPAAVTGAATGDALRLTFGDLTGLAGATQKTTVALR